MQQTDLARLAGLQGDLRIDFLESAALANNALGDPSRRPLAVYLPPTYDDDGSRRYSVLYALHGSLGNLSTALGIRPWEENVVQRIDRLIFAKTMPPVILVVVDAFTRLGGSQYIDSIHNGGYATYVACEITAHVDRHYRTLPREGGRGIFGKSSGGFGALYLAMTYPGVFGGIAAHSPDAHFPFAYVPGFAAMRRTLEAFNGDTRAFVENFEGSRTHSPDDFETLGLIASAAAYSPRAAQAFAVDLPYDPATGAVDEEVFARWCAFDPVEMCRRKVPELHRLRVRYIDCGRSDEYRLDVGARLLARRMRELGMAVTHAEFEGGHRATGYRYELSLPLLADALDHEGP